MNTTALKKTLVLGASPNPARYSHLAIENLRRHGHGVVAIGARPGLVGDVHIDIEKVPVDKLDTVTFYLRPELQEQYADYIRSLHPRRIIFNPGAENPALAQQFSREGIQTLEACTLVLLQTGQY